MGSRGALSHRQTPKRKPRLLHLNPVKPVAKNGRAGTQNTSQERPRRAAAAGSAPPTQRTAHTGAQHRHASASAHPTPLWQVGPAPYRTLPRDARGSMDVGPTPPSRLRAARSGELVTVPRQSTSVDPVRERSLRRPPTVLALRVWLGLRTGSRGRIPAGRREASLWPDSRGPATDRAIWGKRCLFSRKRRKNNQ